jgi:hypothetical protein
VPADRVVDGCGRRRGQYAQGDGDNGDDGCGISDLPGKTEEARRFAQEAMGPRQNEAAASFRRLAVTRETWHVQTMPMGDMVIVVMEAADPAAAFQQWAASNDPFDR